MLQIYQKRVSKLSWSPLYLIVAQILSYSRLNYFSKTFCDARWKIILMVSIFGFQMFIGVFCLVGIFLPNNYDLEDSISCLIIFFTEISIGMKAVTLIYNSSSLRILGEIVIEETSRTNLEPWELKLAKKYKKYANLICIKILILYNLTMVSFIVAPIFSEKDYMMPILMELPGTNASNGFGYMINYAFGSYNVYYGTTVEMCFDIPIFLQACFISFQLDKCIHYCKMLGNFDSSYNTPQSQSKLLRKCVRLHAKTFQTINEVSSIISVIVGLLVVTVVPLLTILFYTLLMGTVSGAPFLMTACVYHLFLYSFLGDVVSYKCVEASNAIYTSNWYNIEDANDRQTILFFLKVSQCDMGFSAAGVYKLSLETFTELMKRVYGAFAFLQKIL